MKFNVGDYVWTQTFSSPYRFETNLPTCNVNGIEFVSAKIYKIFPTGDYVVACSGGAVAWYTDDTRIYQELNDEELTWALLCQ